MKKILSILLFISILGCEKDIEESLPNLTEYSPKSMLGSWDANSTSKIKLYYNDHDQVVQRVGRVITIYTHNPQQIFVDDQADTLIYMDNIAEIHSQYLPGGIYDFTLAGSTLRFEDGRLMYKESHYSLTSSTIEYYYNKRGQIVSSANFHKVGLIDPEIINSEFRYDKKGNLTLVVIEYYRYSTNEKFSTDSLWFSEYDKAPNLTKNLIVFDECFYRALSTNNFRKYTFKRVDHYRDVTLNEERTWEFDYDENGYPIY